jgi:hypothetical protein
MVGKWKLLPEDPVATTLTHKGRPFVFADARNSQALRPTFQPSRVRKHNCLIRVCLAMIASECLTLEQTRHRRVRRR